MGLLGTSAQAFTDNFLKTYMAIGEDRRAEASQKIAQQMAQAKLKEIADEQAMRAQLTAYNQGLMNPVSGQGLAQPFNIDSPVAPQQKQYSNQYEAWQAEGKDPYREALLGQADILSQYNPEKALELKSRVFNNDERVEAQREIAEMRSQAQLEALKERFTQQIELLKQKNDYASNLQAERLEVQRLKIENALKNKSEGKQTDTDDAYASYKAEKKKQGIPDKDIWPRYKFDIWYKQQTQKPSAAETIFNGGRKQMQWNAATGKFE